MQWYGEIEYKTKAPEAIEDLGDFVAVLDEYDRLAVIGDTPPILTSAEVKALKITEINQAAEDSLAYVKSAYPETERLN